jgi:hypothetical protein
VNIVASDSIDRSPVTRVNDPPTFSFTQFLNDDNTRSPASDGIRNSPIPSHHFLGNAIRREVCVSKVYSTNITGTFGRKFDGSTSRCRVGRLFAKLE